MGKLFGSILKVSFYFGRERQKKKRGLRLFIWTTKRSWQTCRLIKTLAVTFMEMDDVSPLLGSVTHTLQNVCVNTHTLTHTQNH